MDFFKPLSAYIQDPVQVSKEQQQQNALIEALRGSQQSAAAPVQTGNVVNANAAPGALQSGYGLGQLFGQLGKKYMTSIGQPGTNVTPEGFDKGF